MTRFFRNSLPVCCKLFLISSLVLFSCCHNRPKSSTPAISLVWDGGKATGLLISKSLWADLPPDSVSSLVQVRLLYHGAQPPVAGEFHVQHDDILFSPLIPFSRGLTYEIRIKEHPAGLVLIPPGKDRPRLVAIYPDCDTVPENLLKFYFQFSKPMAEGQALKYIFLRNEQGDSLEHIFLELNPELWNQDRTVLTLWLDPGRIKRELQPNLTLGPPLVKGKKYLLTVLPGWPDQEEQTLSQIFSKNIIASIRDSICPSPATWSFNIPGRDTEQPLRIHFGKPMDYLLTLHAIHLLDPTGKAVNGTSSVSAGEKEYFFKPDNPWIAGLYKVQIESRLEDLAGNNLDRPFERDMGKTQLPLPGHSFYEKVFEIQ